MKRDFLIQIFFLACLFFILTGGAFLIGWEDLKGYRDLYRALLIAAVLAGAGMAWFRYSIGRISFFTLEPVRTLKYFFALPPAYSLSVLAGLFFITQLSYQVLMHAGMETALWDLGFYDQIIWNTAHGNFLITSVRGGLHVFCEHFKLMIVPLSLVYQFNSSPVILFAVTLLIHSGSLLATYLIAKILTRSHPMALIFVLSVLFYRPYVNGINFLFHTQMLADPLLLFGFLFVLKRRTVPAFIFFVLALMCKETVISDVLGIGLFLISRRQKIGWGVGLLALAWAGLFFFFIEPHYHYPYHFVQKWNVYAHLFTPKPELWKNLLEPNPLLYLLLLFGPFLFLSLRCRGWYWLLLPSLALRLLGAISALRTITYHYTGGLDALIILSSIYGAASFSKNLGKLGALLVVSALLFSGIPQLFLMDRYLREASKPEQQRIVRILDSIPSDYSVLTSERLAAHLGHRPYLYVFFQMFPHAPLEEAAKHPDLIIADTEKWEAREQKAVKEFEVAGYRSIFESGFMTVYERPASDRPVPYELIMKWKTWNETREIPYRKIVRTWVRWILTICFLWVFIVLLFRGKKEHRLQILQDTH